MSYAEISNLPEYQRLKLINHPAFKVNPMKPSGYDINWSLIGAIDGPTRMLAKCLQRTNEKSFPASITENFQDKPPRVFGNMFGTSRQHSESFCPITLDGDDDCCNEAFKPNKKIYEDSKKSMTCRAQNFSNPTGFISQRSQAPITESFSNPTGFISQRSQAPITESFGMGGSGSKQPSMPQHQEPPRSFAPNLPGMPNYLGGGSYPQYPTYTPPPVYVPRSYPPYQPKEDEWTFKGVPSIISSMLILSLMYVSIKK
jgi:hypothetical protein